MFKPELLLPAGSIEAFFAAMEGGADAVYLGLKNFNARNRAKNFTNNDLLNVVNEAHLRGKKVYVTVNTLVKNSELSQLIDTLSVLSQCHPDALIIQDLAVADIAQKFFKNLELHASTQMSVHNSVGCNFLKSKGFKRVVLARELTMHELSELSRNTDVETEIFIHGALCYSLSGQCLFSSYLGGNSANRGLCTQVCRRNFVADGNTSPLFSMKDFQLVDLIPQFSKLKVSSLKVEGRMKTPDYVYNVARAYRMAIDDFSKIPQAKELLNNDFAREKTLWFMGHDVRNAITSQNANTGKFFGKIVEIKPECLVVQSDMKIATNPKLRCRNSADTDAEYIKISKIQHNADTYNIYCNIEGYSVGQNVFLMGYSASFKPKFRKQISKRFEPVSRRRVETILNSFRIALRGNNSVSKMHFFVRVGNLSILTQFNPNAFDAIFAKLSFDDLQTLKSMNIPREIRQKIHIELPKYISELHVENWRSVLSKLAESGFNRFVLSNLSQKYFLPRNATFSTNENAYLMNDAAVIFERNENVKYYCYPLETDYPNLISGSDRNGIIPIYSHPELFFSRMPVHAKEIHDEAKNAYNKSICGGFTIITDKKPTSWTNNTEKFLQKGFSKFLIDISAENDIKKLSNILQSAKTSQKLPQTADFNMKKGLK